MRRDGPQDDQRLCAARTLAWPGRRSCTRRGWAAPAWPVEHGGCGWSAAQRYIFASELRRGRRAAALAHGHRHVRPGADRPRHARAEGALPAAHPDGRGLLVPGLFRAGVGLGPGLAADERASTTATTSSATATRSGPPTPMCANWMFCLVRTSTRGDPPAGHHLPADRHDHARRRGAADHDAVAASTSRTRSSSPTCACPRPMRSGKVGEGWTVAKYLMEFERGGGVSRPG